MERSRRRRRPSASRKRIKTPGPPPVPDEALYAHVRGDLIRIGVLALTLFGALVLLRLLWEIFL